MKTKERWRKQVMSYTSHKCSAGYQSEKCTYLIHDTYLYRWTVKEKGEKIKRTHWVFFIRSHSWECASDSIFFFLVGCCCCCRNAVFFILLAVVVIWCMKQTNPIECQWTSESFNATTNMRRIKMNQWKEFYTNSI